MKEEEEKARELAIKYCKEINSNGKECYNIGCEIACNEMSDWKDEQALKAFCKFQCPDILSESNRCQHQEFEEPCQSYKLFEKLLKGEE